MTQVRSIGIVAIAAALTLLVAGIPILSAPAEQASASGVDALFLKFWNARSPQEAAKVATEIAKSGVTFDDALRRLRSGRAYNKQPSGIVTLTNKTTDGVEHYYAVNVPEGYDPARRYQVRIQLHGGTVARTDNRPRGSGAIGALAGAEQIYVLPYSWSAAPWWSRDQILNLNAIVDALKRTYNVDENRIVVSGVSDGGTGVYYVAMKDTTPFASFLPLNGFLMVLANEADDKELFPNNLRNKPIFAVNGGRDPLYPTSMVEPFIRHFKQGGVTIDYHPQPDAGHNTAWWPEVKDVFETFVAEHPRNPDPDRLTWETADLVHNRAHWLVIDRLGSQATDAAALPDINEAVGYDPGGTVSARPMLLFGRQKPHGRVDLARVGNMVEAKTAGVAAFTLLLSPDSFDFNTPIRVIVNGRVALDERVQASVETLLKWAARDNDRTMLYAAERQITLSR